MERKEAGSPLQEFLVQWRSITCSDLQAEQPAAACSLQNSRLQRPGDGRAALECQPRKGQMEKRVGTWGQGSENGLREDGSGDKAVTSLDYRWERMRASLACGKDECQPGLSGKYTIVKANVWEEGSQGLTPPSSY